MSVTEMKKEDLERLHKVLLIIVDEIDRVCEKNNIKYSLIGGSMLGAIRHRGFIPWDDDVDIGMLRQDYDRFISACERDLDERFILQTNQNDPYYVYGFGKVLLKDTFLVQFGHERTKCKKGIYVDVFPYDKIPDDHKKRIKQKWVNFALTHLLRRKFGVSIQTIKGKKKLVFLMGDVVNLFFSRKKLVDLSNRNMLLYSNDQAATYVSAMSGFYGYDGETIPASFFDNVIRVPFEDRIYSIVSEYDAFLTSYYGDYMQLPPVDKRRTHAFQTLDFGPYQSDDIKINNRGEIHMKRVITYGTFDLLHYGHINLLKRAKALGDYLVVAISTDEFNWNEKQKKCYFTYEQRKALVEAVRYVDLVIPEESWEQKKTDVHEYHIDTFVIGDDWKGKFDFLKEEGCEVVYLPRTPEISTTQIKHDLNEKSIGGGYRLNTFCCLYYNRVFALSPCYFEFEDMVA